MEVVLQLVRLMIVVRMSFVKKLTLATTVNAKMVSNENRRDLAFPVVQTMTATKMLPVMVLSTGLIATVKKDTLATANPVFLEAAFKITNVQRMRSVRR